MRKMVKVISLLLALVVLMAACPLASAASEEGTYQTIQEVEDAFRDTYMVFLDWFGGEDADTESKAAVTVLSFDPPLEREELEEPEEHGERVERRLQTEDGEFSFRVFTKEDSDLVEGSIIILDEARGNGLTDARNGALIYAAYISLVSKERGSEPLEDIIESFMGMFDESLRNGYSENTDAVYSYHLTASDIDSSWILTVTHVDDATDEYKE